MATQTRSHGTRYADAKPWHPAVVSGASAVYTGAGAVVSWASAVYTGAGAVHN